MLTLLLLLMRWAAYWALGSVIVTVGLSSYVVWRLAGRRPPRGPL